MAEQSNWPGGLTDEEAVQRLQSLMVAACEGTRDIASDRDYRSIRTPLIKRADLSDVVPKFIRSHRDLTSFWSYIRKVSDKYRPRREHIWESFKPLFDRIEGRTRAPIPAAGWTGRRTAKQQAMIVLAVAPNAMQAVEMLLEEQKQQLGNGAPGEEDREKAIEQLKQLRSALGELIDLAEAGQPLASQLQKVRAVKDRVLKWSTETYQLTLSQSQLLGSSAVIGSAVWFLVNLVARDAATAVAGTAVAAHVAGVVQARPRPDKS